MKELLEIMLTLVLLITMIAIVIIAFSFSPKTSEEVCSEQGGIPILNWNNSKLKDCIFPTKDNHPTL